MEIDPKLGIALFNLHSGFFVPTEDEKTEEENEQMNDAAEKAEEKDEESV